MGFVIKGEFLERYTADGNEKMLAVPAGVKRIGTRAFYECPAEEILLPGGIYYIGEGAFSNSRIKQMKLPDSMITLCEGAFLSCDRLTFAEIPAKTEALRRDTFWGCFRMKKCRIHEGIKKIQPTAFSQCRNAIELCKGEYRVTLPYLAEWDMSSASTCLQLIASLNDTEKSELLFTAVEREDHQLPLAVYLYAVHESAAAAEFLKDKLYSAAVTVINDDDNYLMLEKLTELGKLPDVTELYESAERAGAKLCTRVLEPYVRAEREAAEKAAAEKAAAEKAAAEKAAAEKAAAEKAAAEKAAAEKAAAEKAAAELAAKKKAAEEAEAAKAAEMMTVTETSDGDLDFAPRIEVFRRLTIDSAPIYKLRKGLTLHGAEGFECVFDTDNSTLVINVTNELIMRAGVRSLLYRAFFGEAMPSGGEVFEPKKRMIDMDLEKEFSGESNDILKMLLTESDLVEASEVIDEWSVPINDYRRARQPVPAGATHEHCIYRNGRLEYYELFSWNVRVAEFEGGTLNEMRDGAECEWNNRSVRMFIDSLPALYRVDRIAAEKVNRLRFPYTCHTVRSGALEIAPKRQLTFCRKGMTIGGGVIAGKTETIGTEGSAAQAAAEKAGLPFKAGFGTMRGEGRVYPTSAWSLEAPEESVWRADSDYMSPMLELVNCGGAAAGKTVSLTFITEEMPEGAEKGLETLYGGENKIYNKLYADGKREIGLGVELYVFRLGEISGLTAATYYISGYAAAEGELTTLLTSYVGSPKEAAAAVEAVYELMKTISFEGEKGSPALAPLDIGKLSEELKVRAEKAAAADNQAAGEPSHVVVSNDWALTVPKGYVWSVDPDVIRGHRCLLVLNGGEGTDAANYYGATESYSCMASQGPICSGDLREYCNKLRIRKLGLMSFGSGSADRRFVLKHTSDTAVFVQLQEYKGSKDGGESGANAVFRAEIVTQNGVYPMQVVFSEEAELLEHENKLAELLMSVSDKDEVCADTYMRKFFGLNAALRRTKPRKEETAKHYLETKSAEEGFDSWLRMGIQLRDSIEYALRAVEGVNAAPFALSETAWQTAEVFAVDGESYDPKFDREQEIKHCFIRETEYMTAFRSFVWLTAEHCAVAGCKPADLDADTVLALAQLVESRGCLCYNESVYPAVCGVPDMNVLYVPDGVREPAVERLVKSGEWTSASLDVLRQELAELKPCMDVLKDYLSAGRDRSKVLCGIHSDILYAWCSMAIAANRAFAVTTDAPVSCDFGERMEMSFADFVPSVLIEAEESAAIGEISDGGEVKSLICGERVMIEQFAGESLVVDAAFKSERESIEIDGYAFILTNQGKVSSGDNFVFFGQNKSPCGTVAVDEENSCRFTVELSKAGSDIANIVLVYAVYGDEPADDLSAVHDMVISFSSGGRKVMEFVPESFNAVKSMAACEIYRHKGVWKIRAVGRGYKGSLAELCAEFGVEVE